jgi:hypothetical protein
MHFPLLRHPYYVLFSADVKMGAVLQPSLAFLFFHSELPIFR